MAERDELHDLFERATDGVAVPSLAPAAWRTARRRRTRRRGAAAAGLASVLVVGVLGAAQLGAPRTEGPPSAPTSTKTSAATATPGVEPTTYPQWDPRDVDKLPAAAVDVAPVLPDDIEPPAASPALVDAPVGGAVLVVRQGATAQLLGTDGSWRSLDLPSDSSRAVLSPDGTRLVVWVYADRSPVVVHDLGSGESRDISYPDGYRPWDFTSWSFLDERTLLLDDLGGGFLVDAVTGVARRVDYPSRTGIQPVIDASGGVLETGDVAGANELTDWAGGRPRTVSMEPTGRLERLQADAGTVVGTTYENGGFALVVADRTDLSPVAVQPVLDHLGNYTGGGLSTLALTDDGTVLLRISVFGRDRGFRIVAWQPGSGEFSIVSHASLPVEDSVTYAADLLRAATAP